MNYLHIELSHQFAWHISNCACRFGYKLYTIDDSSVLAFCTFKTDIENSSDIIYYVFRCFYRLLSKKITCFETFIQNLI